MASSQKVSFPCYQDQERGFAQVKNISSSLTLKSELEAMNIGRSNALSFSPGIEL